MCRILCVRATCCCHFGWWGWAPYPCCRRRMYPALVSADLTQARCSPWTTSFRRAARVSCVYVYICTCMYVTVCSCSGWVAPECPSVGAAGGYPQRKDIPSEWHPEPGLHGGGLLVDRVRHTLPPPYTSRYIICVCLCVCRYVCVCACQVVASGVDGPACVGSSVAAAARGAAVRVGAHPAHGAVHPRRPGAGR